MQILCRDKTEGKRVVEQVLDIKGDSPNWEYLNLVTNDQPMNKYPTIPEREVVLGESRRMPRSRPIADVRFRYARLQLPGTGAIVNLVDTENRLPNLLVVS